MKSTWTVFTFVACLILAQGEAQLLCYQCEDCENLGDVTATACQAVTPTPSTTLPTPTTPSGETPSTEQPTTTVSPIVTPSTTVQPPTTASSEGPTTVTPSTIPSTTPPPTPSTTPPPTPTTTPPPTPTTTPPPTPSTTPPPTPSTTVPAPTTTVATPATEATVSSSSETPGTPPATTVPSPTVAAIRSRRSLFAAKATEPRCYRMEVIVGGRRQVNRGCTNFVTDTETTCTAASNGLSFENCVLCENDSCNSAGTVTISMFALIAGIIIAISANY